MPNEICKVIKCADNLDLGFFIDRGRSGNIHEGWPRRTGVQIGGYLLVSTTLIGLLWLSRTIPTLIAGSVPAEVELGTTLTVQAFDLAFFLPGMFLSGLLLIMRKSSGLLLAPISTAATALILMALLSKGISMQMAGIAGALPMIVRTSIFGTLAVASSIMIMRSVKETAPDGEATV